MSVVLGAVDTRSCMCCASTTRMIFAAEEVQAMCLGLPWPITGCRWLCSVQRLELTVMADTTASLSDDIDSR